MQPDLKGKTGLITGAGKKTGIGYAIAERLAQCGANIALTDLGGNGTEISGIKTGSRSEMDQIAADLARTYGVRTLAIEMDVCNSSSIAEAAEAVKSVFSRVDALFNNAGAVLGAPQVVHHYDEDAWIKTIDVCLHGVFRVSKAFLPLMRAAPAAIVNIASRAAKRPPLFNGAYGVAKAGVVMLTKVMALELGGENIRVNAVCPGLIMTDMQVKRITMEAQVYGLTYDEAKKRLTETVPLKRIGEPSEVADLAVYLASSGSSYITGQAFNVGGGITMEL
jgi:NAD(P)-dependent dehydrogenase (short-subunit alcohol dehydrogenase family)